MEENLELEQEIDEAFAEIEEDYDDEEESEAAVDPIDEEESDDDNAEEVEVLEYDDDGNVIVANESPEAVTETDNEENVENDPIEPTTKNDTELDDLKKRYNDRESLIKDVLKVVGIEESDIDQGLAKLAAETEGVSVEDFLKKRSEALKAEAAQKYYEQMLTERMVASDLNELHSAFPETKDVNKFADIPNVQRYAELRDLGLSVREAYNAANPDGRRNAIVNSVKQQAINASKSHLKSNVPIASKDTSIKISKAEMETMRDLFPEKSDKELVALYKKTI